MLFCFSRGAGSACRFIGALGMVIATVSANAQPVFSETWESYTTNSTSFGDWILDAGKWGQISDTGINGGKCYLVEAGVSSRMRHRIDVANCNDIVLQAWLYDSGEQVNKTLIGLTDEANSLAYPMIRFGVGYLGKQENYIIAFSDRLQSKGMIIVDTKMPYEKGWHFIRLDITHDHSVRWRIWNTAQTVEKTGNFGWMFDKNKFRFVILGSIIATPGAVGWDDIKVGSLEQIGPPPALPASVPKSTRPEDESMKRKAQ